MATDFILGTSGHIDHGKTSLIRALTGTNTDRLPEEKKRGITIELGFALLELGDFRMGIVDVPGHEKFVRNMLAGATGMDLAMLVVAADDSIKQQTREHLEILRLLDLPAGVIAITKCDSVEPDWLDLVEEEVRELVRGSFLEKAEIVRTSAHTGLGIDELRSSLQRAATEVTRTNRLAAIDAPFRMPIDRTFSVEGHGTVVTGSVATGRVRVGDEILVQPGNLEVRVRSLQNHTVSVDEVHRGQRAAINLAGVRHHEIQRGQELTARGHLIPCRILTVNLSAVEGLPRPIRDRSRVRLHVGAAEILCNLRLLERSELQAGQSAPAQLFLSQPAVTTWNQPFVVRSESPVTTIGGGQVLDPNADKIQHAGEIDLRMVKQLSSEDSLRRASATLYFSDFENWHPESMARTAGIDQTDGIVESLRKSGDLQEIVVSPTRTLRVHQEVMERVKRRILTALKKLHDQNPLRSMLDRKSFLSGFAYLNSEPLLQAILDQLKQDKQIRISTTGIGRTDCGPKLSKNEQTLLTNIVAWFKEAGLNPPTVSECQQRATKNRESVPQLVTLAVNNGDVVQISAEVLLHVDVLKQVKEKLRSMFANQQQLTMAEIRDGLQTTRKYAVPLCEYLDDTRFTIRDGDYRTLNPSEASPAEDVENVEL